MEMLTTPIKKAQSRCLDCNHHLGKIIERVVDEPITEAVIAQIIFGANYHEQRHKEHRVEVTIYEHAPEVVEVI